MLMRHVVGAHRVDFHPSIDFVNVQIKDRESKDAQRSVERRGIISKIEFVACKKSLLMLTTASRQIGI